MLGFQPSEILPQSGNLIAHLVAAALDLPTSIVHWNRAGRPRRIVPIADRRPISKLH